MSSPPYLHGTGVHGGVGVVMTQVLLACVPGIAVLSYYFGWGILCNLLLASLSAMACEGLALALRGRAIGAALQDGSVLVSAFLIAIALPPYCPWWIVLAASVVGVLIAKHAYGGLGYNPFNPAMVAYVFLLISFPVEMTAWALPLGTVPDGALPGFVESWQIRFSSSHDALTSATPLDLARNNPDLTLAELREREPVFGHWAGVGWEQANLAFLLGGLYLLYRRIFSWHAPAGFLGAFSLLVALFHDGDMVEALLFHWLGGATMLGAFFIITDPVSSAVSNTGRLFYGMGAGALLFVMRAWSNYPDAVAFAVLLMNFAAPLIDYYTQPRTYGHR